MSYGAYPSHTTILHTERIKDFFNELGITCEIDLKELYKPFSDFITPDDFISHFDQMGYPEAPNFGATLVDYFEEEDFKSLESAIQKVNNFQEILKKAEEKSGLYLGLLYVGSEGDCYDDLSNELAIEVGNVYKRTPSGEKYQEYLLDVSWVTYG